MSVTANENDLRVDTARAAAVASVPTFIVHDAKGNEHAIQGSRYEHRMWYCENSDVHGYPYSVNEEDRYWSLSPGRDAFDVVGNIVCGVAYTRLATGGIWCPSCVRDGDVASCPRCGEMYRAEELVEVRPPEQPDEPRLPRDVTPIGGVTETDRNERRGHNYIGQSVCSACYGYIHDGRNNRNRNWVYGPFHGDSKRGEFIRTSRTVGVEYEMTGHGRVDGILQPVGIGSDPTADIEVRTPPAKGKAADIFTIHTLDKLVANGWRDGNRAGLHVHVHAPEFAVNDEYGFSSPSSDRWHPTDGCSSRSCGFEGHYVSTSAEVKTYTPDAKKKNKARARFIALWVASEQVAYKFDPGRRDSEWSRPLTNNRSTRLREVSRALSAARRGEFIDPPNYDRYRSANFQALDRYNTIEFRGHGATTDSAHAVAWVAFVQGMLDLSFRVTVKEIVAINQATTIHRRSELVLAALRKYHCVTAKAGEAIGQVILFGRDSDDS